MSLRKISFAIGEFYHVYNRGNHKREIFLDSQDRQRFQRLLYLCNGTVPINVRDIRNAHIDFYGHNRGAQLVAIGAYCLMPNHFHILLTPLIENGASLFMKKLGTSYSMYFNKRYKSVGSLFEGRFKSSHASDDTYLKYLYSYIHLNPAKLRDSHSNEEGEWDISRARDFLATFPYSSLLDYLGEGRGESAIISPDKFPEYFLTKSDHLEEVSSWLSPRTDLGENVSFEKNIF
jgi:REP element-mobilizing transposase RayT